MEFLARVLGCRFRADPAGRCEMLTGRALGRMWLGVMVFAQYFSSAVKSTGFGFGSSLIISASRLGELPLSSAPLTLKVHVLRKSKGANLP